jgi:hypothetical protein
MSAHVTIGCDNGATGTIAIIGPNGSLFDYIPTMQTLQGRAGKVVTRVDHFGLKTWLEANIEQPYSRAYAYVERPFTGKFLNAVLPGQRAYEAVLIVLEQLGIGHETIDSKGWQKAILGDIKGSPALKQASKLRGIQMYPAHAAAIKSHGDADGLLIAHHYHHYNKPA